MKRSAILGILIGIGLAITLLASNDFAGVMAALLAAGWGIALVILLHLPQTLFSALGLRALIDAPHPPGVWLLYRLRWIREAANNLLPVAQIGGDFIRARLLARRGVSLRVSVAACIIDLSVEMTSQIVFTLLGAALLLIGPHAGNVVPLAIGATALSAAVALAFMASQRLGVFSLVERAITRSAAGNRWAFLGELNGLNGAVLTTYRQPRRMWASGLYHLASWGFGALETYAAMKALGLVLGLSLGAGFREAVIIESLGQAVKGLGFFIPGALGVQEGGYLLICAMFGIRAPQALALSLIRRIRDLVLGAPGLLLWHRMEGPSPADPRTLRAAAP